MTLLSRLMRVQMVLRHVLYLNYLVPAPRVRPLVPEMLPLAIVDLNRVFVSVVILRSEGVRATLLPFPSFNYNQINVRTYVIDPVTGKQAVCFIKSGVTSAPVSFLTRTIGIPWQHVAFDLKVATDEVTNYTPYEVAGSWDGEFSIKAQGTPMPPLQIPPFGDTESAVNYLVRPLIGFFGKGGQSTRFSIRHPQINPCAGKLSSIHFPILNSLNLVEEKEMANPQSVLFVPEAQFYIYLPPTRIKGTIRQYTSFR
ncbi:MAG: hypothetical protein A2Y59_02510 [Chloroflexi bacterium RBG_13_52_14]|nr:MAG: hypothetical protein A2Y59_02510 [Chloroflexi bacterium RBG_13_52_14]